MFTANCLIWMVLIAIVFIALSESLLIKGGPEVFKKWGVYLSMALVFIGFIFCEIGFAGFLVLFAAAWFLTWLSPKELTQAISRRLDRIDEEDARRRATAILARRIRVSLALERYPHDWTDAQLARLFDRISARNDLLVATFGDIAAADMALDQAKARPREPDPGCSQSSEAVGGRG